MKQHEGALRDPSVLVLILPKPNGVQRAARGVLLCAVATHPRSRCHSASLPHPHTARASPPPFPRQCWIGESVRRVNRGTSSTVNRWWRQVTVRNPRVVLLLLLNPDLVLNPDARADERCAAGPAAETTNKLRTSCGDGGNTPRLQCRRVGLRGRRVQRSRLLSVSLASSLSNTFFSSSGSMFV